MVTRPACWQGAITIPGNNSLKVVNLSQKWMNDNIGKEFQNLMIDMRSKEKKNFIPIPEGDNEGRALGSIVYEKDAPYAQYFDVSVESEKRRCVFDSAASGLYFLGFKNLSRLLSIL